MWLLFYFLIIRANASELSLTHTHFLIVHHICRIKYAFIVMLSADTSILKVRVHIFRIHQVRAYGLSFPFIFGGAQAVRMCKRQIIQTLRAKPVFVGILRSFNN